MEITNPKTIWFPGIKDSREKVWNVHFLYIVLPFQLTKDMLI